jgi:hypothetical protein
MHARHIRHWSFAVRSLGVLLLTLALVSAAGVSSASAGAPPNHPMNGGGDGIGGNNHDHNGPGGCFNCCDHDFNCNRRFGFNFPRILPIPYPVFQPIYTPIYMPVYLPPTSPIYGQYGPYANTQSYIAQPTSTYTAAYGVSSSNLPIACHAYQVALQYGTQTDNPSMDQLCGTVAPTATSGTTTPTPSYPTTSPGGPSYTPYP